MTARRPARPPTPLDPAGLERIALAYVGRYATSRAKLVRYLARKVSERGWDADTAADPAAVAARMAALGYVDDAELAGARGRALARAGYGARRVAMALDALGIACGDAAATVAEAEADGFARALRFAERRRIGPYATMPPDEAGRRRAMGAMLRAGHAPGVARKIVAAAPGEVPAWDE